MGDEQEWRFVKLLANLRSITHSSKCMNDLRWDLIKG